MSTELLPWQKIMIQNSIITKSHAEIAGFLQVDIAVVAKAAIELNPEGKIFTRQMKLDADREQRQKNRPVKLPRPTKERAPKKKKENQVITRRLTPDTTAILPRKRDDRKRFATAGVNYRDCTYVKIDRSTHIVIKPGEDVAEKIRLFKKHYQHYLENKERFQFFKA